MATPIKKYVIDKNRLSRGYTEGFAVTPDGGLAAKDAGRRIIFLGRLDSNQRDCEWGRLRFDLQGDAVPIVRAFASNDSAFVTGGEITGFDAFFLNPEEKAARKLALFEAAGAARFMGKTDVLLYAQTGQYLWVSIELVGEHEGRIDNLAVYAPRDNFYGTLPEIYRGGDDDFLHRYLSIFSTLYYDLQDTIDNLDRFVDVDTAPREALPILASWLGLELEGDFLGESQMRKLIRAAFALFQTKGTRQAVETLLRVFVDEPFYIVEQRVLLARMSGAERAVFERLYGRSPFDYTVMLCRAADERLHAQLKLLLGQFTMLRCRVNIVFLEPSCRTDGYAYLDINARVLEAAGAALDAGASMGDMARLQ